MRLYVGLRLWLFLWVWFWLEFCFRCGGHCSRAYLAIAAFEGRYKADKERTYIWQKKPSGRVQLRPQTYLKPGGGGVIESAKSG